jgi:hypothetical protein
MTREERDQLHRDNLDLLNKSGGGGYAEKTHDFLSRIINALPVADPAPVGEAAKPIGKFQTGDAMLDSESFRRSVNNEWADLLEQLADYDALAVLVGRRILEDRRNRPTHPGFIQAPAPTELEAAVGELLRTCEVASVHLSFAGLNCTAQDMKDTIARVRAAMGRK